MTDLTIGASDGLRNSQQSSLMRAAKDCNSDHTKAARAAQQFEGILLSNVLNKLEETLSSIPGDDPDQDSSSQSYREFSIQTLSTALAPRGPLGIAHMILPYLERANSSQCSNDPNREGQLPRQP